MFSINLITSHKLVIKYILIILIAPQDASLHLQVRAIYILYSKIFIF
ncbi:MAG: hypothetical protein QG624_105 [Pseudomonadota bacterium]|jgi:hypothetical protein|nr:hypothetical protein [Pseudomonadota bacterium]